MFTRVLQPNKLYRFHDRSPNSTGSGKNVDESDDLMLGPHANEDQMPRWLIRVLENGDKMSTREVVRLDGTKGYMDLRAVETPHLVPVLARLSRKDSNTLRASYCDPRVHHVAKMRREGSFCGYRNLQMLITYIRDVRAPGYQNFDGKPPPSIFQLQEMIEHAWDQGFNNSGRDEIGKLRMTRKFIGTSEAEALFTSLHIPVSIRAFIPEENSTAHQLLIDYVSRYFDLVGVEVSKEKVVVGLKPPLFLQRRGHSMTVVGIDEDVHGARNLIVFDPGYKLSTSLKKAVEDEKSPSKPRKLLKAHQYGVHYLQDYDAFELVNIDTSSTTFAAKNSNVGS